MLGDARGLHLDLHARHVDAGGAFAPAGLAGDAELERLRHLVRGQRVGAELARDREAQRIGAAAGDVALVAGDAVARAHDAAGERAAGAVVVAHLDRALETAAGAGIGRPVEPRIDLVGVVIRRVTEQRAVVEFRRIDDLARIEAVVRIEARLDLLERAHQLRPEHLVVEFRAHDAVAVLARMRALVGLHHVEGFLGDRAHRLDVVLEPQVEHRPHMQAADRGVRIPGAAGAVLLEDGGEPRGVVREMLERHRAVLDERDRFALLLHRHHDVEAGGAHLGDGGLQGGIEHLDHPAPFCAGSCPRTGRDRPSAR